MEHPHAPATYNALRTAWKSLVQLLGGIEATATCVRVGRSQVAYYGDVNCERHAPVDVVLDAETIAGKPLVTLALASALGYTLVPVVPRDAGDLSVAMAEIGRDASKLFGDAASALSSHEELTDAQRGVLAGDLDELIRVASEARQLLAPASKLRVVRGA